MGNWYLSTLGIRKTENLKRNLWKKPNPEIFIEDKMCKIHFYIMCVSFKLIIKSRSGDTTFLKNWYLRKNRPSNVKFAEHTNFVHTIFFIECEMFKMHFYIIYLKVKMIS